jgi:uncharacterized protein
MRHNVEPGDRRSARRQDRQLTPLRFTRIAPDGYRRTPWRNGGGVSVTIADERTPDAAEGDWSGVVWQLGRTAITTPAPFSDLSGFERLQTVVSGEGLFLDAPDFTIDLSAPFAVVRYDGGASIVSRLEKGPVEVVNLIARRDRVRIGMSVLRAGEAALLPEGRHVLHAPTAAAALRIGDEAVMLPHDHGATMGGPAAVACLEGVIVAASIHAL